MVWIWMYQDVDTFYHWWSFLAWDSFQTTWKTRVPTLATFLLFTRIEWEGNQATFWCLFWSRHNDRGQWIPENEEKMAMYTVPGVIRVYFECVLSVFWVYFECVLSVFWVSEQQRIRHLIHECRRNDRWTKAPSFGCDSNHNFSSFALFWFFSFDFSSLWLRFFLSSNFFHSFLLLECQRSSSSV